MCVCACTALEIFIEKIHHFRNPSIYPTVREQNKKQNPLSTNQWSFYLRSESIDFNDCISPSSCFVMHISEFRHIRTQTKSVCVFVVCVCECLCMLYAHVLCACVRASCVRACVCTAIHVFLRVNICDFSPSLSSSSFCEERETIYAEYESVYACRRVEV